MRINVVCVGKIKEKFYTQAVEEYSKRLSRYCKLDIVELPDEKTPDNASDIVNEQIKNKEGERILSAIKDDAYLCVRQKTFYSIRHCRTRQDSNRC